MKKSAPPTKVLTLSCTSYYNSINKFLSNKFNQLNNKSHQYILALLNLTLAINLLLVIVSLAMIGGVL